MQQSQRRQSRSPFFQISPLEETLQRFDWFEKMRADCPVFYNQQTHLWEVFGYEDANRAMTDYAAFSSEAIPGFSEDSFLADTVVAKDPPDHRKLRNLVNLAFTPRAVNHLEQDISRITQELLDEHLQSGQMDVVADIAFPLPAKVIAAMLGVPDENWDLFRRWAGDPGRRAGDDAAPATRQDAMQAQQGMEQQMYGYFSDLLAERRRAPREDLISTLSVAEIDGERLSESDLVKFCILLLAAGQETTKNLIANAIYCLTEYPQASERLIAHPELMPAAIEEVLRYMPPVWFTFRRTTTDVELGGQHLPANAVVQIWQASANRDSEQFRNPAQFDIERDPNRHLTFGHGIHFCIGAPLARLEARVVLPMMLEQLKQLQRRPDEPLLVRSGIVYVIQALPVTFAQSLSGTRV
jgi:cytochrome P450 family 109